MEGRGQGTGGRAMLASVGCQSKRLAACCHDAHLGAGRATGACRGRHNQAYIALQKVREILVS